MRRPGSPEHRRNYRGLPATTIRHSLCAPGEQVAADTAGEVHRSCGMPCSLPGCRSSNVAATLSDRSSSSRSSCRSPPPLHRPAAHQFGDRGRAERAHRRHCRPHRALHKRGAPDARTHRRLVHALHARRAVAWDGRCSPSCGRSLVRGCWRSSRSASPSRGCQMSGAPVSRIRGAITGLRSSRQSRQ